MSDLVSPILTVMNNEAQAYICFCGLMRRMKGNFSSHGKTMSKKFKVFNKQIPVAFILKKFPNSECKILYFEIQIYSKIK